jgi:hypothetical protein
MNKLYVYIQGRPKQIYEITEGVSIEQVFSETKDWPGTKLISIGKPSNDSFDWAI